jgi:hypothetical protein
MHRQRIGMKQPIVHRVPTGMVVAAISRQLESLQQYAADHGIEIDASSIRIDSYPDIEHDHEVITIEAVEQRARPRIIIDEK